MAEESARPYFTYSPLYPAERAFTNMFAEIQKGDVLMPSPLLTFTSPQIRLHFQYGPDGRLSSPQVPAGNMRDLAEAAMLSPDAIEQAARRLDELGRLVSRKDLAAALAAEEPTPSADTNSHAGVRARVADSRSSNEYMMRSQEHEARPERSSAEATAAVGAIDREPGAAPGGLDRPRAVLARRVRVEEGMFLQGCWLDWDVIRRDLVASVRRPRASRQPGTRRPREAGRHRRGCLPRCRCGWSPGPIAGEPGTAVVAGPPLALDRLGVPGARRGGDRALAPRRTRA